MDFALPSACAQQVLERLSLDGFGRHAPGAEARNHCGIRAPQRGCIRVAGQVSAKASLGCDLGVWASAFSCVLQWVACERSRSMPRLRTTESIQVLTLPLSAR